MGCVYLIQNLANGKCYVGQTQRQLCQRYSRTLGSSSPKERTRPLHRAIKRYGHKSFDLSPLMSNVQVKELDFWETFFIRCFDSLTSESGYNLEPGGHAHKTMAEETKKKLSEAKKKQMSTEEGRRPYLDSWKRLVGRTFSWSPLRRERYNPRAHGRYVSRTWFHDSFGRFDGGITELRDKFPDQKLSLGRLSILANHKQHSSHKGWRIDKPQPALNLVA